MSRRFPVWLCPDGSSGVGLSLEGIREDLGLPAVAKTVVFQGDNDGFDGEAEHDQPIAIANSSPEVRLSPVSNFGIDSNTRIDLHFQAVVPRTDREMSDLCLSIDYDPFRRFVFDGALGGDGDDRTEFGHIADHERQASVAVDPSELVEPAESRGIRVLVPVRLHEFHDLVPVIVREWLQPVLIVQVVLFSERAREFELTFLRRGRLPGIADGGGVDGVVQGASEVVEPLTDQNRHLWWRRRLLDNRHDELPVALVVNGGVVRIVFQPSVPEVCRRLAVGFSSVDAMPTRAEWIVHALPLEEDVQDERPRADTGNTAQGRATRRDTDSEPGRGIS